MTTPSSEPLAPLDPYAGPPYDIDDDPEFWSQERIDQETVDALEFGMADGWVAPDGGEPEG